MRIRVLLVDTSEEDAMLGQIALILLCLGVGFFFGKKGVLNEAAAPALVRLTVDAVLPCALFSTMRSKFNAQSLIDIGPFIIIPFASILLLFLLAFTAARFLRLPANRRGIFASVSATSNTIFLGLPVSLALLGPGGLSGALMYYMGNTTIFWSLGLAFIKRDAGIPLEKQRFSALTAWLKALASPAFASLALSLVFIFSGLPLPEPIVTALSGFGSMATPLALVYMGFSISCLKKADLFLDRGLVGVILFRVLLSPLMVIGLCTLYKAISGTAVPRILAAAFLLQAAMPVMSQSPIVARREGSDEAFAARAAGLSLLLCPIPLAAIMMLY
jgi:malate permease and related proteins